MEMIKKIAVLYGGSSSERQISLQSGEGVHKAMKELGYESELLDFKNITNFNELKIYDFVFIALHGFEGEGGELQKNLDDLNILYSGSKAIACRNTWNKRLTKEILKKNNITTPLWLETKLNKQLVEDGLQTSCFDMFRPYKYLFLKPEEDGSSVDIFKISDNESLKNAYQKCINPKRSFLFEEYIEGRELTVTIINKECLPPLEIITKNEFYDYDAKYISDKTLHVEAELSKNELDKIKSISLDAFEALDCNGWARVDLLQDKEKNFYIIEINTVPGMTSHSNVPKSGSFLGLTYNEVVQKIIDASL
jgi:D-alanine-D-alanine ligase